MKRNERIKEGFEYMYINRNCISSIVFENNEIFSSPQSVSCPSELIMYGSFANKWKYEIENSEIFLK